MLSSIICKCLPCRAIVPLSHGCIPFHLNWVVTRPWILLRSSRHVLKEVLVFIFGDRVVRVGMGYAKLSAFITAQIKLSVTL